MVELRALEGRTLWRNVFVFIRNYGETDNFMRCSPSTQFFDFDIFGDSGTNHWANTFWDDLNIFEMEPNLLNKTPGLVGQL